jgi:hypothetical protein
MIKHVCNFTVEAAIKFTQYKSQVRIMATIHGQQKI